MNSYKNGQGYERDDGQIVPLAAVMLLLVMGMVLALAQLGHHATNAARARTAADAGALAGAAGSRSTAEQVVAQNGARLVKYVDTYTWVEVTVAVGESESVARAERVRTLMAPPGLTTAPSPATPPGATPHSLAANSLFVGL